MATTNGSTAIRDKILASLARYRALRIGKFPCAFWRLSARPGLTAAVYFTPMSCLNSTGVSLANTCRGLCTYYTNSGINNYWETSVYLLTFIIYSIQILLL
ncbi:hypothetical protein [Bathymodiolus japonicus methanotrophic gill symbiont]|uniref:hypothetical protein n=1 Tax=Bathymodiolus japonicus methanotrophic gill symbiont TaxID=113269 RepID=UPI001C8DAD15|nr:hypothetical protein [Bathymodiolus japonicus methanotrophic gill symbiont]